MTLNSIFGLLPQIYKRKKNEIKSNTWPATSDTQQKKAEKKRDQIQYLACYLRYTTEKSRKKERSNPILGLLPQIHNRKKQKKREIKSNTWPATSDTQQKKAEKKRDQIQYLACYLRYTTEKSRKKERSNPILGLLSQIHNRKKQKKREIKSNTWPAISDTQQKKAEKKRDQIQYLACYLRYTTEKSRKKERSNPILGLLSQIHNKRSETKPNTWLVSSDTLRKNKNTNSETNAILGWFCFNV